MTPEQLLELNKISSENRTITIDEITNKTPRTLIYGVNQDEKYTHTYLNSNGNFVVFIYEVDMTIPHSETESIISKARSFQAIETQLVTEDMIVPTHNAFLPYCDYEFAALMKSKGMSTKYSSNDVSVYRKPLSHK